MPGVPAGTAAGARTPVERGQERLSSGLLRRPTIGAPAHRLEVDMDSLAALLASAEAAVEGRPQDVVEITPRGILREEA